MMKKVVFIVIIFLCVYQAWAQNTKLNIANYTIGTLNVTNEYNDAVIVWRSKQVVKTNLYDEQYYERVYELEIQLNSKNNNPVEKILLTEGGYAGGYAIYFDNVVFPRYQEKRFRGEYYESHEDDSLTRLLYFYDTDSKSKDPYVILELK
jgi:hypothetical protein